MPVKLRNRPLTTFSLISLADIVLLLLIYFLLTSTFVLSQGIRVKLPRAEAKPLKQRSPVVLTLTRDGRLYLNQEAVTLEDLPPKLHQILSQHPQSPVVLMSDREVPLQKAVEVLEAARKGGAERLVIATHEGEG